MRSCFRAFSGVLLLACVASGAFAQLIPLSQPLKFRPAAKPAAMAWKHPHGVIHFNTNVGSFKLLSNGESMAEGVLDFVFRGTVLISDMDPNSSLVITGNVRKEIDDKDLRKVVYFGDGRMTLTGRCRAVQFFGRGLRASFNGFGVVRMVGEFDRDLNTGLWWYSGDKEQQYWITSVSNMPVPRLKPKAPDVTIKPKAGG